MVESDSAQVYEMAHDERTYEMPVLENTAPSATEQGHGEAGVGDDFIVSDDGRPRTSRMVEQL